jgi:hypothetical protein
MYNLASASAATGVNKSTVLRAIKAGRLSAQRDETGGWSIDPAELHRVFAPLPAAATASQAEAQRDAITNQLVAELRSTIADLRQDRDHWRDAFERQQLLLPLPEQRQATEAAPTPMDVGGPLYRAWRWMRKAG